MKTLLKDLSWSFRVLIRNPGFTAAALLTLTLGIGAGSAIFSVVNAVLIRPLPYAHPERLVTLFEVRPSGEEDSVAPANFIDWKRQSSVFSDLAGFRSRNLNMTGAAEPLLVDSATVSPNLFSVLGVDAQIGRTFTSDPVATVDDYEVVLSDVFWRRRFGADPGILGKKLNFDGEIYTVVGVTPPEFRFFWSPEVYVKGPKGIPRPPGAIEGDILTVRDLHYFRVVGRLKPGVELARAQAEMDVIARRLALTYPDKNGGRGIRVIPLRERLLGKIQPALLLLFGAVGLVQLIACANVANLLLARTATREREMAIRMALGAERARLVRQLVTESLVLALVGGGLGLLLGIWGINVLVSLSPDDIPRLEQVSVDGWVAGFTLLLSVLTAIFVGLLPALHASSPDSQSALKEGGSRSTAGARRRSVHRFLVVGEIAVALVLLISAGLLVKSFLTLRAVDPGFEPNNILTLRITLPELKYREDRQAVAFFNELVMRIREIPNVTAAAASWDLPTGGGPSFFAAFSIESRVPASPGEKLVAGFHTVTPGYFRVLGIPVLKGRDFDARDREGGVKALIINRSMAERFWPQTDPLGKRISFGKNENGETDWFSIIGVVGDVRYSGLEEAPGLAVFTSFQQEPEKSMSVVVRTEADPLSLVHSVKERVLALDRGQPVDRIQTMEQLFSESMVERRFGSLLLVLLAGMAAILALVGSYGVMSYSVNQRTREIGIRMALGAQRREVLWMVMWEAGTLGLLGAGLGVIGAVALMRTLSRFLFGISAVDLQIFSGFSVALVLVVGLASYLPARRAMNVDPVLALQQ